MRYYREYQDEGKRVPTGNVVATDGTEGGYVGLYPHPNSVVSYGVLPRYYLSRYCAPISADEARVLHPRLFERLAADGLD